MTMSDNSLLNQRIRRTITISNRLHPYSMLGIAVLVLVSPLVL